ncbi:MAG: hypothetical protein ABIH53_02935 [archaeon]
MEQETKFYNNWWFWVALVLFIYCIWLQHENTLLGKIIDGYEKLVDADMKLYGYCKENTEAIKSVSISASMDWKTICKATPHPEMCLAVV